MAQNTIPEMGRPQLVPRARNHGNALLLREHSALATPSREEPPTITQLKNALSVSSAEQIVVDSPLEEDGFELPVPH